MENEVRISVKALVSFLLRGGSIDSRFSGTDRAAEGARIHRRLQKMEKEGYTPEVTLRYTCLFEEISYRVEGRADGVYTDEEGLTVLDEIKTTTAPKSALTPSFNLAHWAQGECYAYFYCLQHGLKEAGVRLTYFQVDTEEVVRFHRRYTLEEMQNFYEGLLSGYAKWARFTAAFAKVRAASLAELSFPFPAYRAGQRELAVGVYKSAVKGYRFFCQAPTGIGKTISTLYPAMKAMGEGEIEKVFYLTSKTTIAAAAEEAVEQLRRQGMRAKNVTITAKDKICFLEERVCNPDACPYANGYFDRVNEAVYELLLQGDCFTRAQVEQAARAYCLCPFELSLDLSSFCDVIVCDYNYLFDPVASLKRFFEEGKSDHFFLIDEAHNLPDRARDMYSALLSKKEVLRVKKSAAGASKKLSAALGKLNGALLEKGRSSKDAPQGVLVEQTLSKELLGLLRAAVAAFEKYLNENRAAPEKELLLFYFDLRFFIQIAELLDENYQVLTAAEGGEVTLRLLCMNPSPFVDACLAKGKGAVLFSATLTPLSFYMQLLGGEQGAKKAVFPSPFPAENLCLLVEGSISTKYQSRKDTVQAVAASIAAFFEARPGNYIAYFPSYSYLRLVEQAFEALGMPPPMVQIQNAAEEEKAAFLSAFQPGANLHAFCVMGGVFGEGIDLVGERLSGCCIVGVGLPGISPELALRRAYFDEKNGDGFGFTYRYPGMNKVLQAAGRVIRTAADKGAVLLIDERFATPAYRRLFPSHWQGAQFVCGKEDIQKALSAFWQD